MKTDLEFYPPPDKRKRPPIPLVPSQKQRSKWTGTLPDKYIASLVTLVSRSKIENWINDLSAYHTRHTKSVYIDQVANWLKIQLQNFGYTSVNFHNYTESGHQLKNVICHKQGTTDKVVLICAHYDCRMGNLSDAASRAPGADDNATGVTIILELARILSQVDLEDSIQFAFFSGEEQGFWGSKHYAQYLKDNNVNLHRLINLDQVGYSPSAQQLAIVERDMGNVVPTNDQDSQAFSQTMEQMAIDYTDLQVMLGPIYGSDYMPFEARGYVVIGAYEKEANPNYHKSTDLPSTLDMEYITSIAKMVLATILKESAAVIDESLSPVDVYIRDNKTDDGSQPSGPVHWESPDIWVRNNPPPSDPNDPNDPNYGENPDAGHQVPIVGVPNYLYVNVHNRGSQSVSGVKVEAFHCNPGTQMIWPSHFVYMGFLTINDPIASGGTCRVGPFNWTPQVQDHECLLAITTHSNDHSIPDIFHGTIDHGILVRYDNNIGQRNVSPKLMTPGGKTKTIFFIRGTTYPSLGRIVLDASKLESDTKILLRLPRRIVKKVNIQNFSIKSQNKIWSYLSLSGECTGSLDKVPLSANEEVLVTLEVDFSIQAEHLKVYPIIVTQEINSQVMGRITIEITAIKEVEDFVYGNPRSMELHQIKCPFWPFIGPHNKVPFLNINDGLVRGYNGCAYCLPEYNTD